MNLQVGEGQAVSQAATKESTVKMLGLIDALPHGVQRYLVLHGMHVYNHYLCT
jgi:hypothetical protein